MANGESITLNKLYEVVAKLALKIEELGMEVHELKEERMAPEYKQKLLVMEKEKGKHYKSMAEFDTEFS